MRKLIGITSLLAGILLIVVPRYVLPACEFEGFARMHCSDTARAEMIVGGLFILIGAATLLLKAPLVLPAVCLAGLALSGIAFLLPDQLGYCQSGRMPCNYGMVPGVRFISTVTGLIMIVAFMLAIQKLRKKGMA